MVDDVTFALQWLCYTVLCQVIDVFGVGANIINIIVFTKQGFKDTVNISLVGLAVSDIGCVSTLIWSNICYTPAFRELDLPFDSIEVNYLTSGIPHTVFTRITCWTTAFITLERCLCIAAPLKVKAILTPKRVTMIIIFIFIVMITASTPVYVANKLDAKFSPERNRTLIGLVYRKDRETIEGASFFINNLTLPFTSFIINVVCTITIAYKLKTITEWRNKTTRSTSLNSLSTQNMKVAKMVVMISTMFIICFVPVNCMFIGCLVEPELFLDGKYKHIIITLGGFGIVLESINSSANIFIYYNMSINYRTTFTQVCPSCNKQSTDFINSKPS